MTLWNMDKPTTATASLKILLALSITLIVSLFNPASLATSKDIQMAPKDFQVTLVSAGLGINRTERDSVTISADGQCRFWSGSNVAGDDSTKREKDFKIKKSAVSRIYQAIESHRFSELDSEYRDSGIRDGDMAELTVRMNGTSKTVRAFNASVDDLNAIARAINDEIPDEFKISYNALKGL